MFTQATSLRVRHLTSPRVRMGQNTAEPQPGSEGRTLLSTAVLPEATSNRKCVCTTWADANFQNISPNRQVLRMAVSVSAETVLASGTRDSGPGTRAPRGAGARPPGLGSDGRQVRGLRNPGPVRGRCAASGTRVRGGAGARPTRPCPRDTDATAEPLCHCVFTSALCAFV